MRAPLEDFVDTQYFTQRSVAALSIIVAKWKTGQMYLPTAVEYSFTHKNKNIDKWCNMMNYANWKKLITEDHTYYDSTM